MDEYKIICDTCENYYADPSGCYDTCFAQKDGQISLSYCEKRMCGDENSCSEYKEMK